MVRGSKPRDRWFGPKPRDRLLVRGTKPRDAMAGSLLLLAFFTYALAPSDARFDRLTRAPGLFRQGQHLLPNVLGPMQEVQLGHLQIQMGDLLTELRLCLGDYDEKEL